MEDMFLDEDLADHVGEPCYYLYDDCDMGIRACYLGEKCDKKMLDIIIDNLSHVFYEAIYEDTVDNFIEDDEARNNLSHSQSYEDLYNYIVEHNVDVSDGKLSWLKVLGLGRDDLLIEFED